MCHTPHELAFSRFRDCVTKFHLVLMSTPISKYQVPIPHDLDFKILYKTLDYLERRDTLDRMKLWLPTRIVDSRRCVTEISHARYQYTTWWELPTLPRYLYIAIVYVMQRTFSFWLIERPCVSEPWRKCIVETNETMHTAIMTKPFFLATDKVFSSCPEFASRPTKFQRRLS